MREAIRELLRGYDDEVRVLLFQTRELRDYAHREWEKHELRGRAVVEAHTKIRHILAKVDDILGDGAHRRPADRRGRGAACRDRADPAGDAAQAL